MLTSYNFIPNVVVMEQNAAIQLRGLPKRYSTVYIDGIKMSDPSSPDQQFLFRKYYETFN